MKRLYLLVLFLLIVPAAFFGGTFLSTFRSRGYVAYLETSEKDRVKDLRETVYGHTLGDQARHSPEVAGKLAGFDPRTSDCALELAYIGGFRTVRESRLELKGDGTLWSSIDKERKLLATLDEKKTRELFLRAISGGLLTYSEGTVQLKKDLALPDAHYSATDGADTEIVIRVPQFAADQKIVIYRPEMEAKTYPDIIEYRLVLEFEKEMRSLVPAGDPDWR